jgi:hypothetical protein
MYLLLLAAIAGVLMVQNNRRNLSLSQARFSPKTNIQDGSEIPGPIKATLLRSAVTPHRAGKPKPTDNMKIGSLGFR